MSGKELGRLFPIIIVEYNRVWKKYFWEEKDKILTEFEESKVISIEHIGSTAIPGLMAKPTIDILMQVEQGIKVQTIFNRFKLLGYRFIPQPDKPAPHMMFVKGYTKLGFKGQAFHVHVRYKGDWDEIYFRNYLRENSRTAGEYEKLKLKLAKKYKYDRDAYTEAKTEFIKKINRLARKKFK